MVGAFCNDAISDQGATKASFAKKQAKLRIKNERSAPLPTSAARKQRFEAQKAEVCQGAGEGAEGFFVVFFNDLECL